MAGSNWFIVGRYTKGKNIKINIDSFMDKDFDILNEVTKLLFDYIGSKEIGAERSRAIDFLGRNLKMDGRLVQDMLYKSLYEIGKI